MTTPISLFLGAIILTALGLDYLFNDWQATVFLGRKLTDAIEWLAFWR